MRKITKMFCLALACLMMLSMLASCKTHEESSSDDTSTPTIDVSGTVSVGEIKNKYGDTDAGKLLPMYNMDPTKPLTIHLKYTPKDIQQTFSVHTDYKCLDDSKVALMLSPDNYLSSGPKVYEARPIMVPLALPDSNKIWGGVSSYYIKFNYDIKADKETKLAKPIIVPISMKSPVPIPNTGYTLDKGCLTLTWTKVEGATSYRVYQRQSARFTEDTNVALSGKEEAYFGAFPQLVTEVSADTFSFNDWMLNGQGGKIPTSSPIENLPYIISYQNQGVKGEYYVTAVVGEQESLLSAGVNTTKLSLPKEFAEESLLAKNYKRPESLPKNAAIKYVDGSIIVHKVFWEPLGDKNVKYVIENTDIVGYVTVEERSEQIQSDNKPNNDTGFVSPEDNIEQNAPIDTPTINNGKEADDAPNDTPDDLFDKQITNTDEVLESANNERVNVPEKIQVTASSAAEEYLALNMVAAKDQISLAGFPELQNWETLKDTLCEVIYQNPMILGVRSYAYDYKTMTLTVKYDYTQAEIQKRQEEIIEESNRIIADIITEGMDDASKRRAIYEYLEANTTYDDAACENAESNGFKTVGNDYRDSFSTYGIIVKKTGVCQSYAYAYDYLCELANVKCIVVTGSIMGYLPHAWNKVEINGEWFAIDVTNNEKSLGVKDFMYENPDRFVNALGYTEDALYYTEDDDTYHSTSASYSKYKDCVVDNKKALNEYIKAQAKEGSIVECLITYDNFTTDDILGALARAGVRRTGKSAVIGGYVMVEVVEIGYYER